MDNILNNIQTAITRHKLITQILSMISGNPSEYNDAYIAKLKMVLNSSLNNIIDCNANNFGLTIDKLYAGKSKNKFYLKFTYNGLHIGIYIFIYKNGDSAYDNNEIYIMKNLYNYQDKEKMFVHSVNLLKHDQCPNKINEVSKILTNLCKGSLMSKEICKTSKNIGSHDQNIKYVIMRNAEFGPMGDDGNFIDKKINFNNKEYHLTNEKNFKLIIIQLLWQMIQYGKINLKYMDPLPDNVFCFVDTNYDSTKENWYHYCIENKCKFKIKCQPYIVQIGDQGDSQKYPLIPKVLKKSEVTISQNIDKFARVTSKGIKVIPDLKNSHLLNGFLGDLYYKPSLPPLNSNMYKREPYDNMVIGYTNNYNEIIQKICAFVTNNQDENLQIETFSDCGIDYNKENLVYTLTPKKIPDNAYGSNPAEQEFTRMTMRGLPRFENGPYKVTDIREYNGDIYVGYNTGKYILKKSIDKEIDAHKIFNYDGFTKYDYTLTVHHTYEMQIYNPLSYKDYIHHDYTHPQIVTHKGKEYVKFDVSGGNTEYVIKSDLEKIKSTDDWDDLTKYDEFFKEITDDWF